MHTNFVLRKTVSKHVWARQLHERPLRLEKQSLERAGGQKVIHTEAFDKVCEALNKVHYAQRIDSNLRVPTVLWAYRTTCKKLTDQVPPRLDSGVSIVIPIEYKMLCPRIVAPADTIVRGALEEGIAQLNEVERLGPEKEI